MYQKGELDPNSLNREKKLKPVSSVVSELDTYSQISRAKIWEMEAEPTWEVKMPVNIKPPFYPIIYVRGYAATMNEIEDTVATPYMGFNLGSTKVRLDHKARPIKFIFESPLIRLMKDCGYRDSYVGGDLPDPPPDGKLVPPRSIWIFRYYEQVSEELGSGDRCTVPEFAADLRAFILRVRDSVCGKDVKARKAFKVNLVAHSMGGLICRCYLHDVLPSCTTYRHHVRLIQVLN